jgi:signal transduction histidine kinase
MVAVIIPLQVIVILSHRENLNERREAQIDHTTLVAQTVGGVVEGFVRDLESFALAAGIALGGQERPFDEPRTYGYLDFLTRSYGILRTVFVTDLEGRVVSTPEGDNLGFDLSDAPYIAPLQQGAESTWSGALVGRQTGQTTVAHARIIRGSDGAPRAYLVVALYPERLVERLPSDLPSDAGVIFIDQHGRLMFSTSDTSPLSAHESVRDLPYVERALAGSVEKVIRENTPFEDDERYGAFVPVRSSGWVVGFVRPQGPLESSLQSRFIRDGVGTSVILFAGVVMMLFIADRISQPLTSLAGAASAIAGGRRPLVPTAAAPHEVMQLEEAMQTMSQAVAEREERLKEQARILAALGRVGASIASELDYQKAAQTVTDAATELTGAEFGAFFFSETRDGGPPFTATGADHGKVASMALLQWITATSHRDGQAIRIDDLSKERGATTSGQITVRSFLAVPVSSRFGGQLGALIFGHSKPQFFTASHEDRALGIARWAAIAMDNAHLFSDAQEAQEQLQLANRSKDEFLGIISHELRTPVTTIYGTARLLETRRKYLTPGVEEDLMRNLTAEAERMHRLVEDLLAVARVELGKETLTEPILIQQIAERVTVAFQQKRVGRQVVASVPEDLPPVMGDETYIEQVLTNLLSNADKYAGVSEPVELVAGVEGDEVIVSVLDRGPGVPTEELPLIFDSFYRSEKTADKVTGKGLGLTVCKRLTEAQGGRIWAELREGGGLKVSFALQVGQSAEVATMVEASLEK